MIETYASHCSTRRENQRILHARVGDSWYTTNDFMSWQVGGLRLRGFVGVMCVHSRGDIFECQTYYQLRPTRLSRKYERCSDDFIINATVARFWSYHQRERRKERKNQRPEANMIERLPNAYRTIRRVYYTPNNPDTWCKATVQVYENLLTIFEITDSGSADLSIDITE